MTAFGVGRWLAILLVPTTAGSRQPEDKDAEQRRALQGLSDSDSDSGAGDDQSGQDGDDNGADRPELEILPDRHAVQKGDTLWAICETYFHDPWRWPKIWALNPEVTNPHWIFPGQMLKLGGMARSVPSAAPASAGGLRASLRPSVGGRPSVPAGGGALREIGFVDAKELAFAGTINGSREEKIMLATGDHAYVEFARDRPPKVGQRFTVYQVDQDNPVKDPQSSATLGYLVRIYGDVTIDAITDRPIASATLLDLVNPVERGYRVGPLFRQFKTVKPRPNGSAMSARVVAAVQPNLLIVEGMFVVLNRGARQGVEVGNRFIVVRQGDGYRDVMEDWAKTDDRFPPDAVADILAIDVRDDSSIGWVTGGNRTVRIGDVADMRKGR